MVASATVGSRGCGVSALCLGIGSAGVCAKTLCQPLRDVQRTCDLACGAHLTSRRQVGIRADPQNNFGTIYRRHAGATTAHRKHTRGLECGAIERQKLEQVSRFHQPVFVGVGVVGKAARRLGPGWGIQETCESSVKTLEGRRMRFMA